MTKKGLLLVLALVCVLVNGCNRNNKKPQTESFRYDYGVFLNAEPSDIPYMKDYKLVVLEATYFSTEDIQEMHQAGQEV